MAKPDSPTAAIVAALRQIGASVEHHTGSAGSPDLVVGYRGRMWFAEVKDPKKPSGVCGCTHWDLGKCDKGRKPSGEWGAACVCRGHFGTGNAERLVWHRQLMFHENWNGPAVCIWTSVEQAIKTITEAT